MIWVVVEVAVIRMEVMEVVVIRMEVVVLRTAVQACTWFEDRVSVEREDGKWDPLDLGEDCNGDGEDYGDQDDYIDDDQDGRIMMMMVSMVMINWTWKKIFEFSHSQCIYCLMDATTIVKPGI